GRATHYRGLGVVAGSDADTVHAARADHYLFAGLAAGVDGDHRYFHADLRAAIDHFSNRPAVLWPAGRPQPANRVPVAAGRHVRVLSERHLTTPCHLEPDIHGHDAVHGNPDLGDFPAVHVPRHRPVAADGPISLL